MMCCYKVMTSADIAAFPLTLASGGQRGGATAHRITGADQTTPVQLSSVNSAGSGTSLTTTSISPKGQCMYLMIANLAANNNGQTGGFTNTSIANNNPSWSGSAAAASIDSADYGQISSVYAHATGASGSATGTITASSSGFNANHSALAFLAFQAPVIAAAPLTLASSLSSAMFTKRVGTATLSLTSAINPATVSVVAAFIRNVAKSAVAAITNVIKH